MRVVRPGCERRGRHALPGHRAVLGPGHDRGSGGDDGAGQRPGSGSDRRAAAHGGRRGHQLRRPGAHTFLRVAAARAAADGSLTLTAHPARLVCGARGDSHFAVSPATVTAHVIRGASITVFPGPGARPEPITPARLPAYLASDQDTRTFLVTGPLSAISGLHEQFRS